MASATPSADASQPELTPTDEVPRPTARRAPNTQQRRPEKSAGTKSVVTNAFQSAAAAAATKESKLKGTPTLDELRTQPEDTDTRNARLRQQMPPPPGRAPVSTQQREIQIAPTPPAHRWVRGAATTRGNRVHAGSQRANAALTAAGFAGGIDENLARSIRDIIRQRSREERAAEARARVAKRRESGEGAIHGVVSQSAAPGDTSKALASVGVASGSAETAVHAPPPALALPAPATRGTPNTAPLSMTPQVLVVDGQIVINEKSLTVNAAVERATALSDFTRVEESGTKLNSATYANYQKAEKWTKEDTEFFFQALRQFGTDFSLIQRLFPGRSRRQIKKKYLVEDKTNPTRVEECIKNKKPDIGLYKNLISVLKTEGRADGSPSVQPVENVARAVLTGDDGDDDEMLALPAPTIEKPPVPPTRPSTVSRNPLPKSTPKPRGGVTKKAVGKAKETQSVDVAKGTTRATRRGARR